MGASLLLFLDSLTHLADGDHVDGGVEGLKRLHQVAILHHVSHAMKKVQRGCVASSSAVGSISHSPTAHRLVPGKRVCQSLLLRSAQRPTREVC
jgi:hypothetical protein